MEDLFIQTLQGLGISVFSILCILFIIWIKKEWLIARLTKSIEHEYATKLEEYKYQIEVKRKAELVAKLLAEWLRESPDRFELNKMAFESYLWLPDDIAKNLTDLLAHKKVDEITVKTVLIDIRKHLNEGNRKYKGLTNEDLIHFNNK